MTKLKFNHVLALASTMALMSGSQTVYSQQTQATETEEIVVTGFRRALQNSMNAKQESTSIVEAIYAEDIGKLPDSSIAESLARLPGLAGERRNGRTSGVSVRGLNEDFVATSLNGRELLGIGDNRGVEFDLYPSEIMGAVKVHKTTDATLLQQGIGGTIAFETLKPLELDDRVISINANYEQNGLESGNADYDDNGHRVSGTFADKFADDTIGVALTVASMESPSQEEQFRAWGFDPFGSDVILGGHDSFVRSAIMDRDTVSGVFQYEPNDQLSVTVDVLDIDFEDSKVFRGVEESLGAQTALATSNGLVTAASYGGFNTVVRNDAEVLSGDLTTAGANVKFQLNDDWAVSVDIAHSETSKEIENLESYSGTGRAGVDGRPTNGGTYELTSKGAMFSPTVSDLLSDQDVVRLAGPQGWGGSIGILFPDTENLDADGNPTRRGNAQDGFINNAYFEEELDSLRLEAVVENLELSIINSVTFGVNFTDRTKSKDNTGSYLTARDYFTEEGFAHDFTTGPIPFEQTTEGDGAVPSEFIVGTTNLGFIGLGDIIAYDSLALYNSGYYKSIAAENYEPSRYGDTYVVDEEVATAYVMASYETGILTGNVGVQVVQTDQSSTGYDALIAGDDLQVQATPVEGGAKYVHLLPSLNMNFQLTDEQVLRFAAAKTITRGRIDDLRPNSTVNYLFNPERRIVDDVNNSAWSASSGNPELKPIEVIQLDLSYEYYYADEGYASVSYFYKDLQNWHVRTGTPRNFSEYIIDGYHNAPVEIEEGVFVPAISVNGLSNDARESEGGHIQGTELQVSFPFNMVNESLDGLGLIASATFLDGEADGGVPGLSDEIYQLTAYYEKAGFQFRISGRERDEFLSQNRGIGLSLVEAVDQGATLWDAQIGYDFSESNIAGLDGLSVTLQVQNLTDEDTITTFGNDARQTRLYQHFGANYLLGVNYKF